MTDQTVQQRLPSDDPHEVDHSWADDGTGHCSTCGVPSADLEAEQAAAVGYTVTVKVPIDEVPDTLAHAKSLVDNYLWVVLGPNRPADVAERIWALPDGGGTVELDGLSITVEPAGEEK